MEKKKYEYEIDGKKYIQEPLVLGQFEQLMPIMEGKSLVFEGKKTLEIVQALGDKLPRAIAIVLKEEGKLLKDKDLDAFEAEVKFAINIDQTLEVVSHFFLCNPPTSLIEKLTMLMEGVATNLGTEEPDGLEKSSSSSATETSEEETKSNGDTPSQNAKEKDGSSIAVEK